MKYQYWLSNIPNIGCKKAKQILKYCAGAEELHALKREQVESICGLHNKDVEQIIKSKITWDLDGEYERFSKRNIRFITLENDDYPMKLRNIVDAPYQIYVKGKLPEEKRKTVAIVGARMCSEYGRAMAREIASQLAQSEIAIVSGLAKGVDAYGHIGALEGGGDTYAVLGCGIDICYPSSNRKLYGEILGKGGIISEYQPGIEPNPRLFPARNRIISGMSDIVVVVEAKERSGSLITADFALEQGKDIYAVPGRITDALSGGCNRLIRQGAGMILSAQDFLKDLDILIGKSGGKEELPKNSLEKEEMLVYSVLDLQPKNIDEIINATGLTIADISNVLIRLQQLGFIEEVFKNYYIRTYE